MKLWRQSRGVPGQSITESEIAGNVYQIFAEGSVSIGNHPGDAFEAEPSSISIAPPSEHLGRPFRGRDDLLTALVRRDMQNSTPAIVNVLSGLGGCGKSTIAMVAAEAEVELGGDVWWISATTSASLHAGMRQLAVVLGAPPERISRAWWGKESATDLLWSQLNKHGNRWTLVIDGADDPQMLAGENSSLPLGNGWLRVPTSGIGSVLVTTRESNPKSWASWCHLHNVAMLSAADGATVLMEYLVGQPGGEGDAEKLARRLGGLPLALRLAGTYLKANVEFPWPGSITTFSEYHRALDEARINELFPELDEESPQTSDREARELIGRTWELSIRMLEARGKTECRALLELLCHYADAPVSVSAISGDILRSLLLAGKISDADLRDRFQALANVGLIEMQSRPRVFSTPDPVTVEFSVHPLVRDVGQYAAKRGDRRVSYLSVAAHMLADVAHNLDAEQHTLWPAWELATLHAFYLLDQVCNEGGMSPDVVNAAAYAVYRTAQFKMYRAQDEVAAVYQNRALEALGSIGADEHPNALLLQHDIAVNKAHRGMLVEAEKELRKVWAAKAKLRGADHNDTWASLHAHANVLWRQGRLPEAEIEYRQVLAAHDKQGKYDRNTLATHQDLTQVLLERGKLAEAHTEARILVDKIEKSDFGEIESSQIRYVLARVLKEQARYDEAIAEMRKIAEIQRLILGADHPTAVSARHELGTALQESGSPHEAVPILREAFVARTKKHGSNHCDTLSTRHQLAVALHEAGSESEAGVHYRATLKRRMQVFGPKHPQTLATRFQLAVLTQSAGKIWEAEREFRLVLDGEISSQGLDHPGTLVTRMMLVPFMAIRGDVSKAFAELQNIYSLRLERLGPNHPATQFTARAIASMRLKYGNES